LKKIINTLSGDPQLYRKIEIEHILQSERQWGYNHTNQQDGKGKWKQLNMVVYNIKRSKHTHGAGL
jgi:hypothetical protein